MKRYPAIFIATLLLGLVIYLSTQEVRFSVSNAPHSPQLAATGGGTEGSLTIDSASAGRKSASKLTFDSLGARFGLTSDTVRQIRYALVDFGKLLIDTKSAGAQSISSAAEVWVVRVPGIDFQIDDLKDLLKERLASTVGTEVAEKIWSDEEARATLIEQLGLEGIREDTIYTFKKNSVSDSGGAVSSYDVSWKGERQTGDGSSFSGFQPVNRYNVGLGSAAFLNAPTGFFDEAAFSDVKSGRLSVPVIFIDKPSGNLEVRNF